LAARAGCAARIDGPAIRAVTSAADPVVIVGAGRHGRVVLDVCLALGQPVLGFLDDTRPPGTPVNGVPILGGFAKASDPGFLAEARLHVALGDNRARLRIAAEIERAGGSLATLVHPSCDVSPSAVLAAGVFVGSFSRVRPNARLGRCALAEGAVSIGTDSVIGEGAFLGPGASLTAATRVDEGAFVGAGAIVTDAARVGAWSVIGAGSTVLTDVPEHVLAVGSPAVVKRRL
jgi:sugar O-acyltransferase (sialic acid O-acetyltransferase NeuD family)